MHYKGRPMADPNNPNGPNGIYVLPNIDLSAYPKHILNIPYAHNSPFQTLDLYFPEADEPEQGFPLIVFVHGGAWMMCDKRDIQLQPALKALNWGYAIASINYRLSSEACFPAQIHDVKAAIRWLRANGEAYGLKIDNITIWGDSAGAHLASLAGTSRQAAELEDLTLGNETFSSSVQAVISWFGPTNFLLMDHYLSISNAGTPDHSLPDSPESLLLGAEITTIPEQVKKANPESWLSADCPPFLIEHGTADPIVPYQLSCDFANRILEAVGKTETSTVLASGEKVQERTHISIASHATVLIEEPEVTLVLLREAKHGGPEFESEENYKIIKAFLDAQIK